ncbi:hypothetical protein V5E97_39980 [Singulisphaera sp. Ch08]|uniref:Ser-Thr-rich glycosyl-phosphatidyl-inositol-anchored membrane family protein n=1 Tax=Singulisphaera sp. Ch08 TaxID=3120278 RepID=A0AAU7CH67_9BACT
MRLASIGLGLALILGLSTPASIAAPPPARASRVPTLYHKNRSFRIPFNVDPSERSRLKEVQLWVSNDDGFTWKAKTTTPPDRPSFTFKATEDDEYWFAVRTLDTQGRLYPSDDDQVEPSMKVIVDTKPPSLVLESDGRRGSGASVRWEVHDEHLALGSLVIEYQVDGADKWRKVSINQLALIGSETWDAGTAEPLTVRAQIEDRAGNIAQSTITLPEGTPSNPSLAGSQDAEFLAPPPLSSGPNFQNSASRTRASEPRDVFPPPTRISKRNAPAPIANEPNPFTASPDEEAEPFESPAPKEAPAAPSRSLLVKDTHFSLQYEVEDAGPDGPSTVELFVSSDGGRNWNRRCEDQDRVSPIQVDLPGEGTFGLCLVARSASGLGDLPPRPGDPPQIWVEVDSTPPSVVMPKAPTVGTGQFAGKVAIYWQATDFHLPSHPVTIFWRPERGGENWQPIGPPMENKGRTIWNVPPNVPPRIHLRIEVVDTVGNIGSIETTDVGPVIVDRSHPKSRIIGLDPAAKTGTGSKESSTK